MFDKNRKKRLESSAKIRAENSLEVLQKLYNMLSDSHGGDIHLENFDLKYSFAEVKLDQNGEDGVIEDIPSDFEKVLSLSFDLFVNQKKEREIIFDREGVRIFPFERRGLEKEIINDILSSK
ncbi:hypothetical protein ACNF40_06500 [Cuniculiplasma sp. SKW4]|uniref:hypothetical protein n=1 Tax=Cuniculiplasma sp. SKW4 TaxID=3400171 RepID=UPI003FCF89C3